MNIKVKTLLSTLILGTIAVHMPLHAELLILKQVDGKFVSLDSTDKGYIPKIEEVLLKYQWPMSAAYGLDTIDEKTSLLAQTGDLFKPNIPNAEEIFIEQKIRIFNNTYRVVFIPTCLYELFVLYKLLEPYKVGGNDNLQKARTDMTEMITLGEIIGSDKSAKVIRQEVNTEFTNINRLFFTYTSTGSPRWASESPREYINRELCNYLLLKYQDLSRSSDSLSFSKLLEDKALDLQSSLINAVDMARMERVNGQREKSTTPTIDRLFEWVFSWETNRLIFNNISNESEQGIIAKVVALEYDARKLNKAILMRGTSMIPFEKGAWKEEVEKEKTVPKKQIAGSTIQGLDFEKDYLKGTETQPYSVSFGNSLFAGAVHDTGACAYYYLYKNNSLTGARTVGYALFIDKRDYIKNNNNRLFFISPLSTLAALFGKGEYFHSRSLATIKKGTQKESYCISGLHNMCEMLVKDTSGLFLIERDPLKHAALFSQFIADNGTILQLGDDSTLTEEEKAATKNLIETQKEAAGYYKGIKGIKEKFMPKLEKVRSKIEERKASGATASEEKKE